ncbi:galactose/methyl galactoside ABC transporter, ATP-binding protein [Escherichia coli]|uniref:Ribose/galactose/methyl galactoside import ATP-binding protein n=1 Tax=Escherichia coli TaxID=562 RepID=A0A376RHP6_ECOLX|nr:galactose/methyl galactoside ABC transporter, ATP-binding protein [Escherichia coli]
MANKVKLYGQLNDSVFRGILVGMSGINKSFPGVKALDNVNLKVRPHSIHALMGENGAGKSTLLKCLFGIYQKDSGTILFQGKEIDFHSAKEALENGISMVHQELNLVLQRSVMDNMWLGRYPTKGMFVDQDKMYRETKAILMNWILISIRVRASAHYPFRNADDRNRQSVFL